MYDKMLTKPTFSAFFFRSKRHIRFTRRPPPRPLTISSTPKLGNPVARHGSYLRPHAEFDGARRLVRCPNDWASWLCQQDAQKVPKSSVTDFSLKKALKSGSSPTPSSKKVYCSVTFVTVFFTLHR